MISNIEGSNASATILADFDAICLALIFIAPVLLSPLIWWVDKTMTLRASRVYLPAFCRYLQDHLRSDPEKTDETETGNTVG